MGIGNLGFGKMDSSKRETAKWDLAIWDLTMTRASVHMVSFEGPPRLIAFCNKQGGIEGPF